MNRANSKPPRQQSSSKGLFVYISAVTTPILLFICTTNTLYIENREDLAYQLPVLLPFGILFILGVILGLTIIWLYEKRGGLILKTILGAFLLLGPFFLAYSVLHVRLPSLMNQPAICVAWTLLFMLGVSVFSAIGNHKIMCRVVGAVAIALFFSEILVFMNHYGNDKQDTDYGGPGVDVTSSKNRRPNIYHIVFDEYQTDMFTLTLTDEFKARLDGFIFFPENTSPFGRTRMALAATFLGKPFDYERPQIEYQLAGYNSPESFLYWLLEAGYESHAFIHPIYGYKQRLFHHRVTLEQYQEAAYARDNTGLFFHLWLYTHFPDMIARIFVPAEDIDQLKNKNLLPDSAPIISYSCYQKFLSAEKDMPEYNRYVFMHLILPHFPNVMRADGTFGKPLKNGDVPQTSPLEQAKCATKMIADLVGCLKSLNRYGSSIIIIHGDHGSRYKLLDNRLVSVENKGVYSLEWSRSRSRALLLVKPPSDRYIHDSFKTLYAETSLLNIAPTILDAAGIRAGVGFPEKSLLDPEMPDLKKTRYYHFYDKKSWHGWTDEMKRYAINGDEIGQDQIFKLTDNPPKKGQKIFFPW